MEIDKSSCERIMYSLHDALYTVDKDRVITYWNRAAEEISGFSAAEVVGKSCANNILTHIDADGCCLCDGMCPLAETIADGKPREEEVYMHHKNGQRIPVSVRVNVLKDSDGNVIGGVELFTDISNRAANELRVKELERLALIDSITRLANRNYINKEIQSRLEEQKRFNVPFGVLFIDIDNFKDVNDTHGHATGDKVLRFVADTLILNGRPFDFYGRWGGDEFIGVVRNMNIRDLQALGERLRILIEKAYLIQEGQRIGVTVSLGATLAREEDTIESLTRRVDGLLYTSKTSGRNRLTTGQ